ncbi:MAG: hypothetical protein ACPGYK_05895 [Flavobacteriales bacterium]
MKQLIRTSTCRNCGEKLRGRRDKLFCDDHCRVRHHRRTGPHLLLKKVDAVLMRNRTLLRMARNAENLTEQTDLAFTWLRQRGFDFTYHTHVEILSDGRAAVMCYEEGYVVEAHGVLLLQPEIVNSV